MSEAEKMVPMSVAARLLTTGFEWEAGIFIEVYKELITRMSKEEAREIMGKAMFRAGKRLGEEARSLSQKRGTIGMAEVWDVIYAMGTEEADTLNEDQFVIRGAGCPAYELIKRWGGLSEEDLKFVGEAYCAGDAGQAKGFDEDMHFQHTCRLFNGDECCIWEYSANEPQVVSKARVPEKDFS